MPATSTREIHRLLDEAPFVGALARALAGPDADEVIQSTWLRATEGKVGTIRRPREWLACVVRGFADNLRRGRARRQAHERAAAARRDLAPSAMELVERQERRQELVQAVQALPEQLRTVVLLRYFEDLPPRRIAEHLDLPVTTVSSRLRTAIASLRHRLDERHGDRRAWLLPILPARAATAALATGILAMTMKTKVIAAVGLLVLAVLAVWTFDSLPGPQPPGPGGPGKPPLLTAEVSRDQEAPQPEVERTEVLTPAPAADPTTGTLLVNVTYEEDGTPVPDLLVYVGRPDADTFFGRRRVRTDAEGLVRVADLEPGPWKVSNARNPMGQGRAQAVVVAGRETEVELRLPPGVLLTGIVVDWLGRPVAGAEVYLHVSGYVEHVTTTGPGGRFTLRSCLYYGCLVGARAEGCSPSRMHEIELQEGSTKSLRIELPGPGGTVEGVVRDRDGKSVADAIVEVGEGSARYIPRRLFGTGPTPAATRTSEDGTFRAVGLAAGRHPVKVRAAGMAPWEGSCRVESHGVTPIEITMSPGMSCSGVVVGVDGAALEGAIVTVGERHDFAYSRATSGEDGTFRLDGLPPGEVEVKARHETGRVAVIVRGAPGETVACELRMDPGIELRGRVIDAAGEPVARAWVEAQARPTATDRAWGGYRYSDDDGRFAIPNCPEGRPLTVQTHAQGYHSTVVEDVDPRAGDLLVRLAPAPERSVRIVGSVVGPEGEPVQATVSAMARTGERSGLQPSTSSGAFEIGPLAPGSWRVRILAEGHPWVWTEWRDLGPEAVWDLGKIWLPVPGTVLVRVRGPEESNIILAVCDATLAYWSGFERDGERYRSLPLAPGRHYVSLVGDGVASRLVPVEVRSGEVSEVELEAQTGYRQRFEIHAPVALSELDVRLHRGDVLVHGFLATGDIRMRWQRWLAPGDYTITASGIGFSGRVRFSVREGSDEIVRVVMQ